MLATRKTRIVSAFDRASDYDAHAHVQRQVAGRLADRIASLDIDITLPVLEIGCGTGFLTAALLKERPGLRLTITDIAPAMVERARRSIGERPGLRYCVMDGEQPAPAPEGGYGLILSSLTFQWFGDLQIAAARLIAQLAPGGWLAFTTLTDGTFATWRNALRQSGTDGILRAYPPIEEIRDRSMPGADIELYSLTEQPDSGAHFLRGLKAIGAHVGWNGEGRLSPAAIRRALAQFDMAGPIAEYEIAQILIRKDK